jgi:hypothetical protein
MKRAIVMGTLALILATIATGCVLEQAEQDESRKAAAQFLGKDRVQITKIMGEPKGAIPMTDTGGEMFFYSYQGHHYVLETNPLGVVDVAVRTS